MPFWKEVLEKHFWMGVLLLFLSAVTVDAIGAAILCHGWLPMLYAHSWILVGWLVGGFVGARFVLRAGKEQPLLRATLTCAVAYALAWGIGLGFSQGKCNPESWWHVAVVLAIAAFLAALVGPGKKRGGRKKPKRGSGKAR